MPTRVLITDIDKSNSCVCGCYVYEMNYTREYITPTLLRLKTMSELIGE